MVGIILDVRHLHATPHDEPLAIGHGSARNVCFSRTSRYVKSRVGPNQLTDNLQDIPQQQCFHWHLKRLN